MESSEKSHFQGGGCRRGHPSNGGSVSWSGEHTQSGCPVRGQPFTWGGGKINKFGLHRGGGCSPTLPHYQKPCLLCWKYNSVPQMYFRNSGIGQKHFKTSPLYTRSNYSSTSIKKTWNYDQKVDSNLLFLYFFVALEFHKLWSETFIAFHVT